MSQNYKETLNLPQTQFPMKADLVKREPQRLAEWEAAGLYGAIQAARADAELFVLHDGPPFANGDVHMGTALNKILKDFVVKSRAMLGFRAPYIPGWDCHGLPIEFKVVKESRGLAPAEVRRRSEEYARKWVAIQREQFARLGVFGEWEKPYLTLDPPYEAEIIRAFAGLVERGLVYQALKPVSWSTGAQTALAEAEVEFVERTDPAVYVAFEAASGPLAQLKAHLVIWTTTPWTLPANVAIAVHADECYLVRSIELSAGSIKTVVIAEKLWGRFLAETQCLERGEVSEGQRKEYLGKELVGTEAQHPFLERTARVIAADFVTTDTGTGQVHIAPGHGKDDYLAGQQNRLPLLSPVDEYGKYTAEVGVTEWVGKYVFDANADVVALLKEKGALIAEEKYVHEYPHCWRSKTPIVFRAVEQFFVKIDALRSPALLAIDQVEWVPSWGRNRIYGTVESRPDWCISRQRAWGVPLPVFYDAQGGPIVEAALARRVAEIVERDGTNVWFERDDAWWCAALDLPAGTTRRNDTLDVWIDSGVSHVAVLGKHPELQPKGGTGEFRPADVYLEATDQHRGWFQSSLITSVALHDGKAPYKTVITHGFVVDKDTRKKVSKSAQGTYAKPMDAQHFVDKYGADIVRLWASSVEFTNEVPFSEESFAGLADAYRQFRNVLRILLANSAGAQPESASPPVLRGATTVDRWMLSRLQAIILTCREAYKAFDFRKVFQTLNQFVTVEISALYVDITKDRLYCDGVDSPRRIATQFVMRTLVEALARLLAPILAFTADEAWEFSGAQSSVHLELFPAVEEKFQDAQAEAVINDWLKLRGIVGQAVEPARQEKLIGNALEALVTITLPDADELRANQARLQELEEFLILSEVRLISGAEMAATLVRQERPRCPRCWRHYPSVGSHPEHPDLCDRCARVLTGRGAATVVP